MEKYSEIEKKTKNVYINQHKNYDIDASIFQRHFNHAVDPKSYDLDADFFKGKHVLDAGCGNSGYFQVAMHALGARKVTCLDIGTDWQPELEKIVLKHGVPEGFCEMVEGSTTSLPFGDEAFDFVASNGVLMHLESIEMAKTALRELARVTVGGGRLYAHIGIDKPGIVDRYIVKSLRLAYIEDLEFRSFIDNLNPDDMVFQLGEIYSSAINIDRSLNSSLSELIGELFTLDSATFLQNMLQVPVQQGPLLSEQWGIATMSGLGLVKIRRVPEAYWIRNDFRKYLAPIHHRLDTPISKLFYGNGHVKLVAEKP